MVSNVSIKFMSQHLGLASVHILVSLLSKERHGYEIMRCTQADSHGVVKLGPTTLYSNIRKLLEAEYIEESSERPDPEMDDTRRRYYRLTSKGRSVIGAELERMDQLVHLGREYLPHEAKVAWQ